ncbi:hypothetical protein ACUY2L_04035 [Corynebacterium mastitidis]
MRMTKQSWFTLILAIFYGLCTAGLTAKVMVENISETGSAKYFSIGLLFTIAILSGIVAYFIRNKKPSIRTNRIAVIGFTIIYLLSFLMADMEIGMAIFPLTMLIGFVMLPGLQEWLSKE